MKTKQDVIRWLVENETPFTQMADAIWGYAEVACEEFWSSKLQADYLAAQGWTIRWDVGGMNTAFIAEWGTGKPIIGLIGEYDALAGLSQKNQPTPEPVVPGGPGHGCGHNLLGTGGLAAAVAVQHWLQANDRPGTVRYYGCPAEEKITGKTFMARDGAFDDLDAALNFHPGCLNMAGKGSAVGVYDVTYHFHGRTAHAGGSPHQGRSALDAVELMNVGVNYLREHVTEKVRLHYVITKGGDVPNVVPAEAEVWYFIRAHKRPELAQVVERVNKIAQGAALMTETTVEERVNGACSSVLSNHYLADLQYAAMQLIGPIGFTTEEKAYAQQINDQYPAENARSLFDNLRVPADKKDRIAQYVEQPLIGDNFPAWNEDLIETGSTDVGDVSWITPLSMLETACFPIGASGHSWGIVAASAMSIGHKGMMHAAKVMALTAIDLYTDPQHLVQIRREFEAATKGQPYQNPTPPDLQPPRYHNPARNVD